MNNTRLAGHGLRSEGAPFMLNEDGNWARSSRHFSTVSGVGRGPCECGAVSPLTNSSTDRKKWHREHKAEVSA